MHRKVILAAASFCFFCLQEAWADQCRGCLTGAVRGEGLFLSRVDSVGMEDCRPARSKKSTVFTPEKVEHDLAGQSVGPQAEVKVRTGAPGGRGAVSRSHGGRSAEVYALIPMGIVFDETNIMDLRILDIKKDSGKATLIVHVETVSSCAGKLRLQYEHVVDEWILREIVNLSFKAK